MTQLGEAPNAWGLRPETLQGWLSGLGDPPIEATFTDG